MALTNRPMDTLSALQDGQRRREAELKEDEKVVAERVVRAFAMRKDWPETDVDEVLYALGLKELID